MTGKKIEEKPKAKCPKYPIQQLLITSAYEKHFSTGSKGFFGKGIDPATGKAFTIIGAVENKPKAS